MDLVIRHVARLGLFVFTDSAPAIRLYERAGFVIEGTMPRRASAPAAGWTQLMGRLHDR
jgi:RimJ/RimL family protein N-acetyltransferase